jgi:5'-nucleotidase
VTRFVLTNDDGFDAPGLAALRRELLPLGPVLVVAPRQSQSGVGHRVTTRTPIHLRREEADLYSVDGTPADCARIALTHLAPQAQWLVAGINAGANLGSDIYGSGTVAAAREAAILGRPALAISQYISPRGTIAWEISGPLAGHLVRRVLAEPCGPGEYWNANLPHPLSRGELPAIVTCPPDPHPHQFRFRQEGEHLLYQGVIHDRPRAAEHDVAVCFGGRVALSRLSL